MAQAVGLKRSAGTVLISGGESFFVFFFFLVITVGTPFFLVEAVLAEFGFATGTWLKASVTVVFFATLTARHTFATVDAVTVGATVVALATDSRFTLFANPSLVVADKVATVGTLDSVPV